MNTITTLTRRSAALVAAMLLAVVVSMSLQPGSAHAAVLSQGSVASVNSAGFANAYTNFTVSSALTGTKITGVALDWAANDSRCTRVYTRGYNYILGWSGYNLEATTCAGSSAAWGNTYSVYSDHINVTVCAGFLSSGPCATRRAW